MPPRLFVAGSANFDLTFHIPTWPRAGVTELCPDYRQGFGGKGANQAVQAARLGAAVTFLGKVGDDPLGPAYLRHLEAEGVAAQHVGVETGMLTGAAVILIDPSGQNSILAAAGPNVTLSAENVRRAADAIREADVLVSTLENPGGALLEMFRVARSAGVRTVLNTAPAVDFPREVLQLVDVCVPNESELAAVTRQHPSDLAGVEAAARSLLQAGPRSVVVTLGERGALVLGPAGLEHVPGVSAVAVDTSGAGDAFTAALAVALGEGSDLPSAARWANRVAALSVTRPGTQASFGTRAEVDAFANEA